MANEIEIPQYFICPISLQIMKDPVTTITGITYDRESIEKWLQTSTTEDQTCPITKQPLPKDSDLLPNHMLRRLIQAWCVANAKHGIDLIPTPKSPVTKLHVLKLIDDLHFPPMVKNALKKMEELAMENEKNRKVMVEAGVIKVMVTFILKSYREGKFISGIEEALRIFQLTWSTTGENKQVLRDHNEELMNSILWILGSDYKYEAVIILKWVVEFASSELLEGLKIEFFHQMISIFKNKSTSPQAIKSALQILVQLCPLGRNRMKIIESGAIFHLIELGLIIPPSEKKIIELIFCILANLCVVADGRAELLSHAGGLALVAKKILRATPATDDRAIYILGSVARFSATKEVVAEMLKVGAVSKLCMVLQANCEVYLKKQAREILRIHSNVWNNSPCIQVYLLTWAPR
ncbi:hypothetical protein Leryth_012111 [Lithospermum erythrorhizon]|nr:hypothetical protein Leryth_012111 [Lithospermum erythrorhizon]